MTYNVFSGTLNPAQSIIITILDENSDGPMDDVWVLGGFIKADIVRRTFPKSPALSLTPTIVVDDESSPVVSPHV